MKKIKINKNSGFPVTNSESVIMGDSNLKNRFQDDGIVLRDIASHTYKKVSLVNGVVTVEDCSLQKVRVVEAPVMGLCIGNSITLHQLVENKWWGYWGMAASQREHDYVHRLEAMIKSDEPKFMMDCCNVASWEQTFVLPDLTAIPLNNKGGNNTLDIRNYDLIIIRLGENVTDTSNFESALTTFVTSIKNLNTDAQLIISGVFWTSNAKDTALSNVADSFDVPFVPLSQFDTSANKCSVGDLVYGDDGQQHAINDSGVAMHPNDSGMNAIAAELYNALPE